jgi:hypothetical protein
MSDGSFSAVKATVCECLENGVRAGKKGIATNNFSSFAELRFRKNAAIRAYGRACLSKPASINSDM